MCDHFGGRKGGREKDKEKRESTRVWEAFSLKVLYVTVLVFLVWGEREKFFKKSVTLSSSASSSSCAGVAENVLRDKAEA